ncbi:MAG: hypothetical protein S4CHLAM6_00120 [Chlamydiae bacterium]|nr:hypothetical protein [Chlamydiota bacterium]
MSGVSAMNAASVDAAPTVGTFKALASNYPRSEFSLKILDISGRASDLHTRSLYGNIFSPLNDQWQKRLVCSRTGIALKTDVEYRIDSAAQTLFVGVKETSAEDEREFIVNCGIFSKEDLDDRYLVSVMDEVETVDRQDLEQGL